MSLLCRIARLQQLQAKGSVADVHLRLRCHRPNAGQRPRHDWTDLEIVRLHCYPELSSFPVSRDDRIGHGALDGIAEPIYNRRPGHARV